jgi:multiple sugar transport system substrate-binding protein
MLRAKYPKHTIKFLNGSTGGSVAKMMTDKTKFDIYWATSGTYETSAFTYDFAYDMTPLIQKNNVDLNKFDSAFKEVVSGAAFGGRTYFFPVHADVQVTYYNKDLFEKFGVAFPSGNLTWDDFYKLAERMTRYESGVQYTGFAPFIGQLLMNNQMSLPPLDRKTMTPTIASNALWQTYFAQMFEQHSTMWNGATPLSLKAIDVLTNFEKGAQALMVYLPIVAEERKTIYQAFNWDFVPIPTIKEYPGVGAQPYSVNFGINKQSENKELAFDMVRFLATSEEAQRAFATIGAGPVSSDKAILKSFGQGTSFKDKNWQAAYTHKQAAVNNFGAAPRTINSIYEKYANEVIGKKMDLNTALRMAGEEATKTLADLKPTLIAPGAN